MIQYNILFVKRQFLKYHGSINDQQKSNEQTYWSGWRDLNPRSSDPVARRFSHLSYTPFISVNFITDTNYIISKRIKKVMCLDKSNAKRIKLMYMIFTAKYKPSQGQITIPKRKLEEN